MTLISKAHSSVPNLGMGAQTADHWVQSVPKAWFLDWLVVEEVTQLDVGLRADIAGQAGAVPPSAGRRCSACSSRSCSRTKIERSTGLRGERRNDHRPFSPKIFLAIGARRLWTLSLPSLAHSLSPLSPLTPLPPSLRSLRELARSSHSLTPLSPLTRSLRSLARSVRSVSSLAPLTLSLRSHKRERNRCKIRSLKEVPWLNLFFSAFEPVRVPFLVPWSFYRCS